MDRNSVPHLLGHSESHISYFTSFLYVILPWGGVGWGESLLNPYGIPAGPRVDGEREPHLDFSARLAMHMSLRSSLLGFVEATVPPPTFIL